MLSRLKNWLSGTRPAPISDELWTSVISKLTFLDSLNTDELLRLRTLCNDFLRTKKFNAADDLKLSNEMCLSIATQGCLPILNLGLDWYRGWNEIIVYPDEFVIPRETIDDVGVVHRYDEIAAGEAWGWGPLILSWSDVQMTAGEYNVVIHEFTHKIDMLNGDADGCPPLHKNQSNATWKAVWQTAYSDFCHRIDLAPLAIYENDDGDEFEEIELNSVLDPYAAESPGEFFAVASEVFFTVPAELQYEYPEIYAQLALFYRQDPLARLMFPSV